MYLKVLEAPEEKKKSERLEGELREEREKRDERVNEGVRARMARICGTPWK